MHQKSKGVSGTRGQILGMLRVGPRTVTEMASALHLTDNAVRAHLSAFERDGMVKRSGSLPGTRKPFLIYALTASGDDLFPKAYGPILAEMLRVLEEKLPPAMIATICIETGRRLAKDLAPGYEALSEHDRIRLAIEVLSSLGGVTNATMDADGTVVHGRSCPIAEAVSANPQACQLTQSLISAITGLLVIERCQKTGSPRCCFELRAS